MRRFALLPALMVVLGLPLLAQESERPKDKPRHQKVCPPSPPPPRATARPIRIQVWRRQSHGRVRFEATHPITVTPPPVAVATAPPPPPSRPWLRAWLGF